MKNTRMKLGLAVVSVLAGVQPAFAAPAKGSPAWCKGIGDEEVDSATDNALRDEVLWAIPAIVGALCQPDADAREQRAKIEAARSEWSKKLDMNDADWADAAAWSVAMQSNRHPGTVLEPANRKLGWAAMDSIDQYIAIQQRETPDDYFVDALGPKLSEAGRLSYLLRICLSSAAKEVQWAACQADLDAFDPKKLVAELRADKKHTGYERFLIRLAGLRLLPSVVKQVAPQIKAARAQDPAFEKMFQIAAETRATWVALWKSDAALVDLALQLDTARVTDKRSAFQGCEDKTWPAFKAAVATVAATRFGNVSLTERISEYPENLLSILGTEPKAYLASIALFMCEAADTPDAMIRALGNAFIMWPGHRGPRTSTLVNVRSAGLELDDRSRSIDYPTTLYEWFKAASGGSGIGYGTISAVKRQDGKVRVEFAAKVQKQFTCLKSTYTKRIQRILADGTIIYELNCLKWGSITVDKRSDPQTVKARYAEGLKPGMVVFIVGDAVFAAWPKAGIPTPSIVAGVAVK